MFDFEEALRLVSKQTVLCVGDVMLDDFVYGEVTRISPEAPTPVLAVKHNTIEIGGAGNVARNIAALGATCIFVGLVGDDEAGLTLRKALAKLGAVVPELVIDKARPTTRKVRFVSEHHSTHLMRADWETTAQASAESQAAMIAHAEAAMPKVGAVVLSDYAKGVLTERVIRAIIEAARRHGKPVIVDPKGHDYRVYRGATMITPNAKELAAAVHRPLRNEAEIAAAAAELAQDGRERSRAGHAQRTGHEPACRRAGADPHRSLSGQGARCVRCRRHGGRRDGGAGGDANALRIRHARSQRGRRRGGRQARHFDRFAWRVASSHSAGGFARAGRQDRVRLVGARRAPAGMAAARFAHRLHQWLLRSFASRPCEVAGGSARGLRPPGGRIEQRCFDRAAQGRGTSDQPGGRPRRGAGRARSRRSGRCVRGRHAARTDQTRAARRAGEGRRLSYRPGGRPRRG